MGPVTDHRPHRIPAADLRAYRAALGIFPTGVTIVTAADGFSRAGVTVNSFVSVSLDPPLVAWNLSLKAPSLTTFRTAPHFAINVLAADQGALSSQFARPAPDKFADVDVSWDEGPSPLIRGCSAWFECRRTGEHEVGDHVIFFGEVERYTSSSRAPLVFYTGSYGAMPPLAV